MDWVWVIIGIALVIFISARRRAKKQEQKQAQIAREFHDRRKYDKTSALKHYEKVMDKYTTSLPQNATQNLSDSRIQKAPPKKGASYNDTVSAKSKKDNPVSTDPLEGISFERIDINMYGIRPLIGKDRIKSNWSDHHYEIDLGQQTCTCDYFTKKEQFGLNDGRRFCYHMIDAFNRRDAFEKIDHRTRMAAELGSSATFVSAFALQHATLPMMYLLVEHENPWLNIYAREKRTGESIYNASGDFWRHGYNILEKRWAYGTGASGTGIAGASVLKPFLRSLNDLEDLNVALHKISNRPKHSTLSEQTDPRLNPDRNSDQFGPENDHYEIPESSLRSEHPCECSLLFSYIDGKDGKSRRTVDFKKLQFYGSEGSFLYGECRMRRAGRTFNTKKMTDVIDVTTGEIIEDVRSYAETTWQASSKARLEKWATENERIAKAFLFLLKGNKRPTKSDYQSLCSVFSEMLDGAIITTSDIKYLYFDSDPTTAIGFQRLVGGIVKHHPAQISWFKESAIKIANARAKPNFADQAAIDYLNKRIKSP